MRRLFTPFFFVLMVLPHVGAAQTTASDEALQLLLSPTPQPILTYAMIGRITAIFPQDIVNIDISSIGDSTDVLVRFSPDAASEFDSWTDLATGSRLAVSICAYRVLDIEVEMPTTTGTLHIPNLTALQAEALHALWQGRRTCSDLPAEVFPNAQ